ncbi:MAG TPA: dihydrolipoamide acetyltransferase family protein [Verrucomicrobiota bacterium]|nr:dihydrolipoamide acetyltransferase family protein [Verrucomicrobiota bacterium]HNT14752.1 dihydrolipoamide acetyltransferase family protein [Verrucomicrobiota bacterium]
MPYVEMPKLSDTMTEGTVVKWRKAPGDKVEVGDVLAEVETDKAVMELEAFDSGTLKEIYVADGGKAQVGARLALLLGPGETAPSPDRQPSGATPAAAPTAGPGKSVPPPAPATTAPGATRGGRVKASPLARKIAGAKGLDLGTIRGSGPSGRIVARDVESAAGGSARPAAPEISNVPAGRGDRRIPLTGMRKIIAARLLASKTQIPHFYLNIEIDAGELLRLRAQTNAHFEKLGLGKLTINDFILKAVAVAAARVPRANASFAGDAVIEYGDVHLAVAVAVEDGLVTPVIRQAQTRSLREISDAVKDLAARARNKKLKPEEYQGGTLTVSNLGSHGIESFSAVINPPQAMILAIGAIVKKPVVDANNAIVVAHRMAIGLSADHRVVDGAVGAQYLAELRQLLENPVWMLF